MRIDSARNVGINQPTPAAQLHIVQKDAGEPCFRVDDQSGDTSYFFVDDTGRVFVNTNMSETATETFVVNGTTRLKGDVYLDSDTESVQTKVEQRPQVYLKGGGGTPLSSPKVEVGTHTSEVPGTVTKFFDAPFTAAPSVTATVLGEYGTDTVVYVLEVTASEFKFVVKQGSTIIAPNISYMAIGP